jgi:hypothetical protein
MLQARLLEELHLTGRADLSFSVFSFESILSTAEHSKDNA